MHRPDGASVPLTVIVNHLRSLNDVADEPGSDGGTVGARVRAKRAAQAEFLADPRSGAPGRATRPSASCWSATSTPSSSTTARRRDRHDQGHAGAGAEVVLASPTSSIPDLVDLVDAVPAAERYSYVFDGNAQVLDHVLVSPGALASVSGIAFARGNADAPETARNLATSSSRISDHDAVVIYLRARRRTSRRRCGSRGCRSSSTRSRACR